MLAIISDWLWTACTGGRRLRATSARTTDVPPVNIAVSELVPDSSAALCGQIFYACSLLSTYHRNSSQFLSLVYSLNSGVGTGPAAGTIIYDKQECLCSHHINFREREMIRDRSLWPLLFSVIYRLFFSRPSIHCGQLILRK